MEEVSCFSVVLDVSYIISASSLSLAAIEYDDSITLRSMIVRRIMIDRSSSVGFVVGVGGVFVVVGGGAVCTFDCYIQGPHPEADADVAVSMKEETTRDDDNSEWWH
jgi:hypothetical protein